MVSKKSKRLAPEVNAKVKKHLRHLWKTAKGEKGKFIELVRRDDFLKSVGQNWDDCHHKALRMGLYKTGELSPRFWATKFEKEHPAAQKRLDALLADSAISMEKILEDFKEFGVKDDNQLRNYARAKGIKINKGREGGSEKQDAVWKDEKLITYAQESIRSGILQEKDGLQKLQDILCVKFFEGNKSKITKEILEAQLDEWIWTDERSKLVSDIYSARGDTKRIYEVLHFLSRQVIDKKLAELRGVRPKGAIEDKELFQAGVGRLLTDEEMKNVKPRDIPNYTLEKPFVIDVNKERWDLFFLPAPHIGSMYNPAIDRNWVRNFMRLAESEKSNCVIIPSGFLWLDVMISGSRKPHRAEISGLEHDHEYFDPDYKILHKEILEDLGLEGLDIEFVTTREMVREAIYGGYRKVMLHKDGAPIFTNGPVFILLDALMEEVIESGVQSFVRYITRRIRNRIETKEKVARALLAFALSENASTDEIEKYETELKKYERLRNRYIMTYAGQKMQKRYRKIIRTELINWIEEAIPNSKVISMGSVVCQMGKDGRLLEIRQAKHKKVSENELGKLLEESGAVELRGTKADIVVASSAFSPHASWSRRENPHGKNRRTTDYIQLPVAIEGQYVRSQLHHLIKNVDQLERLVSHPRFEGGAMRLRYSSGLLSVEKFSIGMVRMRRPKGSTDEQPIKTPYFFILAGGDEHKGSKALEWYWDPKQRLLLTTENAIAEIFMRSFVEKGQVLPFQALFSPGDNVEADHYGTSKSVHPLTQLLGDEQRRWREAISGADSMKENELREILLKMHKHSMAQQAFRGEDWPMRQMVDMFRESIRPRTRFMHEVIKSFRRAQLNMSGVNDILGEEKLYDWRDLAPISLISGQHFGKTVEFFLQEGPLCMLYAIARILALKDCEFSEEELEQFIRAPLFEQESIGYGVLSAPKDKRAVEYGLTMRHAPTRKGKQSGHPMLNALARTLEMGDYQEIFAGKHLVEITGDIHRIGAIFGPGASLFSTGPCTHASGFGARIAVARSTPGYIMIGLPLWGLDAGPVKVMALTHDFIGPYLREPWNIDWSFFFGNQD